MRTIKTASKTSLSILAMALVLYLVVFQLEWVDRRNLWTLDRLLDTKSWLPLPHRIFISASFWLALISCIMDSVVRNVRGFGIVKPFIRCLILLPILLDCTDLVLDDYLTVSSFWSVYNAIMFVVIHRSCSRLSGVSWPLPFRIKRFVRENMINYEPVDGILLGVMKILLMITWFALFANLVYVGYLHHGLYIG